MFVDDQIDKLDPVRDKPALYAWLRSFLRWHIGVWSEASGLGWTDADVDRHIRANDLVEREWSELERAAGDPQQFVAIARVNRRPVGVVHAQQREERYLRIPIGVVCWIFVEPVSRGTGMSRLLMDACRHWMNTQHLPAAEVFVTAENHAAVALYRRTGYAVTDHRMLAVLSGSEDGEQE